MNEKIPHAILVPDIPLQFILRNGLEHIIDKNNEAKLRYLYNEEPEIREILEYPKPLRHLIVLWVKYDMKHALTDAYACRDYGEFRANWYMIRKYGYVPYAGSVFWFGIFPVLCLLVILALLVLALCFRIFCYVLYYIISVGLYIIMWIVCVADVKCNPLNLPSFSQFIIK